MGFFQNLFSKQSCVLCEKEVGALSRVKLNDGAYLCNDCRKNTSAFINVQKLDTEQVKNHIEYMKLQNELYEKEFKPLQDSGKVQRFVHLGYYGLAFADDIGMFEVILPDASKKNYKELFRYDQIRDYELYGKENINREQGEKRYKEVGIKIKMNCSGDYTNVGASDEERKKMHPYAVEFLIPVEKNCDHLNGSLAKSHLNQIFGRPDDTLFGSIKESFTGTGHEKAGYQAASDAIGALGSLVKGKITGNEEEQANAMEKMKQAATSSMDYLSEGRTKYGRIADEAEIRALGKTFRDYLCGE